MRVLVCGGRSYNDRIAVHGTLQVIHRKYGITAIIHGAASGADRLAGTWALDAGVPCGNYPADWRTKGKAAGPIRNQMMIDEGKPDIVVAFPGGVGTADMVRRAKTAGVLVIEIAPPLSP